MATTNHLGITLVDASQSQKEVTVNTALTRIDALLNTGAKSRVTNTPPGSPASGDLYIVGASPTGAWAGQAYQLAYFDQVWKFIAPGMGIILWVNDESLSYTFNGTAWVANTLGEVNTASNLGAGTGVYASKTGVNLAFKSLIAGSNITLTNTSNDITIAASGSAAAGTLTGSTLAAGVTASSLTSVGTLIGGATGAGFTIALSTSTVTGTLAQARLPAMLSTSGTFASKPGSPTTGQLYFATDLGTNGVWITYTGSIWKPLTGSAVIYQSGVVSTNTGNTANTNVGIVTIPAGLLSANGALRIRLNGICTGVAGTKTFRMYFSATSGGSNGTNFLNRAATATILDSNYVRTIQNANSTSAQTTESTLTTNVQVGDSSSAPVSMAINTANVSYINITVQLANAADSAGINSLTVEWLEP